MRLPVETATATIVATCERCGRRFPFNDAAEDERAFCEPCREALWRDERGLEPASSETGQP